MGRTEGKEGIGLSALDNLALATALQAVFDEERPCESPQHSTRPEDHAGAAQWYLHVKHECGHDRVWAACNRIKEVLLEPLAVATCSGCGKNTAAGLAVRSVTRIGSDGEGD